LIQPTTEDRDDIHNANGSRDARANTLNGRFVMRTLSSLVAVTFLFLAAGSLIVPGGALFSLLLLFPGFLLALVAVLAGLEDRTVRQYNPPMDPRRWRDGS
jgi:hypothetical protein